uniref:SANT domain-containing protein n=1 Tax=Diacronema lutheri TaxID=2081491 RepID=A0A7R9UP50_DIALT
MIHASAYDDARLAAALPVAAAARPHGSARPWSQDENQLFQQCLRQYGKNFAQFRRLMRGRSTAEFVQHYYGTKHRTFVPPPPDNGSGSTRVKRLRRNKQDRVLFDSLQSRDEYACE